MTEASVVTMKKVFIQIVQPIAMVFLMVLHS